MTLDELPNGTRLFIDANIFVYHFGGHSAECQTLLERCARQQVLGYTSTFVIAEILHRLMIGEAVQKGLVTAKGAVAKLAEKPELVTQLRQYNECVKQISEMNVSIVSLTPDILTASKTIRERDGLLTNDSLVIATMLDLEIHDLASADVGFTRVEGIRVYAPEDL